MKDEPSSYQAGVFIVISFFLYFAGLIHVEIELHAHRQMLQVLNQPKEEKLELKNLENDEKPTERNILYLYPNEGGFKLKKSQEAVERLITVQCKIYL